MRVSHAERQEALEALVAHWADGRLDEATFDERATRANAAVTRGDLDALLHDLPPLRPAAPAPAPAAAPVGHRRPRPVSPLLWALGAVLTLSLLVQVVAAATGAAVHGVPWLLVAVVAWMVARRRRHAHRCRQLRA